MNSQSSASGASPFIASGGNSTFITAPNAPAIRIISAAPMTASLYDKEGHRRPRKQFTYKGILVRCKGEEFVLTDDEEEFYTAETPSHQLSLF